MREVSKMETSSRIILIYFFTLWAFLAACSNGYLPTDPDTRYAVAEALVFQGNIEIDRGNVVEHDGRQYSVFFPGQTLEFLPFAGAQRLAASITSSDPELLTRAFGFAASLILVPATGALAIIGFLRVLRQLGSTLRDALLASTVLLVATPLWIYSGSGSEESMLAALGIWTVSALLDARTLPSRAADRLGVACVLVAAGLVHRGTWIAFAAGASIFAVQIVYELGWRQVLRPRFAAWFAFACAIIAVVPLYNWARFGSPWETGYSAFYTEYGGVFATPLLTGLVGHLFSPGKSVFLFVPILVASPLALLCREVRERIRPLAGLLAVTLGLHLIIYSKTTFWGGEPAWGTRYHVSIMPLAMLPVGLLIAGRAGTVAVLRAVITLAVVSAGVQLTGLLLVGHLEQMQHPEYQDYLIPRENAWTWKGSQLVLRIDNLATKLSGREIEFRESVSGSPQSKVSANAWNFFPVRGSVLLGNGFASTVLWLIWGLLIAATAVGTWCVWSLATAESCEERRR
jgi:hypothetical protein